MLESTSKRTPEEILADTRSLSRDCIGPHDPEANRRMMLKMGATEEEADQVARFWQEENLKNGYVLDKAS